jgi:hypothetical protein
LRLVSNEGSISRRSVVKVKNSSKRSRLDAAKELLPTLAIPAVVSLAVIAGMSATPGQRGTAAGGTLSVTSYLPGGTHSVVPGGIRMTD